MVPSSASRDLMVGFASPALISWLRRAMISAGVPFGAPTPAHVLASYPGSVSAMVGTSGSMSNRLLPATPSARSAPVRRRRRIEQQRVSVGRRIDYRLGGDVRTCPRPVLDNDLLTEPLRQPLPHNPAYSVSTAAGRPADDQSHWPRWIGLCPSEARCGRQRGSASCQMQKFPAGKFHFDPSLSGLYYSITSSAMESTPGGASIPSDRAV